MQIKHYYPLQKTAALLMLLLPIAAAAQAQCDAASNHPKPYMWAPKNDTLLWNFRQYKKPILDSVFNTNQTDSFYLGNFLGMMEYFESKYGAKYSCLHIYICAYGKEGTSHVPKDSANKLTLVFAPAKIQFFRKRLKDIKYFNIPPGVPFTADNLKPFKVRPKVFHRWHRNFSFNMLGRLRRTINDQAENNREDDRYTDTRAITYCRPDLDELIQEQCYTHTLGQQPLNISKDLIARFAAHTANEAQRFPKRFFVGFDFTDGQGHIISLEDTDGFSGRHDARGACESCQRYQAGHPIVDNGQLCPPSVNCPSYKEPVAP